MDWEKNSQKQAPIETKESFEKHYKIILKEDYELFMSCNQRYLTRAIRVNTLKTSVEKIKQRLTNKGWKLTQVPWCKEAFWIEGERLDIGNLLEHQLGYIYVQDPASMLPPVILNPQPHEIILDMCASPGSKTSQAAAMMKNKGVIIANDFDSPRLTALGVNLQRMGVFNTIITKKDGRRIKGLQFDKIMVDVPCSGTGTIRRSHKSISMFNKKQLKKLSELQLQLIMNAYNLLKPGGVITYSTCSIDPWENEQVISKFLQITNAELDDIKLDIKREQPFLKDPYTLEEYDKRVIKCLRIHPYTNNTEGFFVAKIIKPQ